MSKPEVRRLLIELKPFIKLNVFAKMVGIHSSSLSLFMRDEYHYYQISEEKLNDMINLILDFMSNFA